ncbi:glycoside hydrolase family 2 TIM barrel-domain containing protein [Nibrella saemangeumensis]|uniref:Glycoside hydrolase family 2 TIM barrel-domain containing protein n=2 Tax=Nibrella saemangeumensis TaxID=1084526 RepID=A0ABP8N7E9_9BACT
MGCRPQERPGSQPDSASESRTVIIRKDDHGYRLYRNGQPFFIKGVGGYGYYDRLRAMGGNSIRVWDTNDAERILDQAHAQDLTVMLGLWLIREKEGFDFFNQEAVAQLKERIRQDVLRYRNHPALLMWCIGNEMELGTANGKVWRVINEIAAMIHELDPNHPTTTAMNAILPEKIRLLQKECPHIDILSVNRYGGLAHLAEDARQAGWNGPYIITEYGPPGYWETPLTEWKAPIEPTSSQKAQFLSSRYKAGVLGDSSRCLGAYAFYWGQKQECTTTWFGMLGEKGEKTAVADMLQYLWSGQWPANKAPHLVSIHVHDQAGLNTSRLLPGTTYTASVAAQDPEGDSLRYHWELLPESDWRELDGSVDKEIKPLPVRGVLRSDNTATVQFTCPAQSGPYRLFVYAYDGKGSVATANVPFFAGDNKQLSSR